VGTTNEHDDEHFIQTARVTDGTWHVEFRDGGPDRHCFAECADLDRLTGIFVDWATGGSSWVSALEWLPMSA
jgi:hypothetical protein